MELKKIHISDIGKVVTGKTPRTFVTGNYGGNIPFLTPSDDLSRKSAPKTAKTLTEQGLNEVKKCLLPPNSVCVSCIGSDLGKVVMTMEPTVTNQQFNSIIPSKDFNADFVYYLMTLVGRELNYLSKTSTAVPIINKSSFSNYEIEVPCLETQKKIASILSSIDSKIELNRRINENLEQQAQALFKSWFVDFEPFKDGKFVDSELGMIPEGWRVGYYTELVDIKGGGTPKTNIKEFWNGSIPFFSPKDIGPSCFVLNTEKYITTNGLENCNSNLFPPYSVFITARGTVGKVVMVGSEMAMNQSNYALLGKQNISQFYVYLITLQLVSHLLKKANGAVFNAITTRDFASERIIIPFYSIIKSFSSIVKPIYENILLNEFQIKSLSQLRDTLLPRLMSGELEIKDNSYD